MTEWRAVLGYEEFYEVSDTGRVRSFDRFVNHWRGGQRLVKGRELKSFFTSKSRERDYLRVGLYKRDRRLRVYGVHVLVLEAFVGPRPEGLVATSATVCIQRRARRIAYGVMSSTLKPPRLAPGDRVVDV
jgi:hypothetical protein